MWAALVGGHSLSKPKRITDTHVHLWDRERNRYPFFEIKPEHESFAGDTSPVLKTYVLKDYLKDVGNYPVQKVVHIQAYMEPNNPVRETEWLQGVADSEGYPQGIVGFASLHAPKVEEVLEGHARFRNHRGIRHIVSWHENPFYSMTDRPDYLTDSDWQRGYGLLAKYGMSFDLQIFPRQLADAVALAERYPAVPLIVEHCAFPIERDAEGMKGWRTGLQRLAALPHTYVKLSALTLMDHNWTQESLSPIIRAAIDIYGPSRTMFGSDFPIEKIHIQYGQWVDAVSYAISDLTEDEQDAVFYRTANQAYRL
jgi:predicted TIM-barrel fold metal-dependent hydrolase